MICIHPDSVLLEGAAIEIEMLGLPEAYPSCDSEADCREVARQHSEGLEEYALRIKEMRNSALGFKEMGETKEL
jgi:hypothetical protein